MDCPAKIRTDVSLSDRYDLAKHTVLLNGTQALVRLMLMQKARDRAAGLHTAGYCTGYRGSPLGAVDVTMAQAQKVLGESDIIFQPGLNEDLAATALWGTQQAELRGEGRFDGVFGLWYGKGPGVDRSGDVMRHANMAGTSRHGGVLMAMGDDHTGESSSVLHQSDWALVDAYMPILSPAGVQEILDYGLYGWALGRYAGVWAGLKTMKDTVEVTSVVDGNPHRVQFVTPDFAMPDGGLNIRLGDTPVMLEARMIDHKRFAAEAFSHANRMDKKIWGRAGAKIGFVAAGKNWLDLVHAFSLLGIDRAEGERLGLTTYKVGQTFPMDMKGFAQWAEGLEIIVVVEEKRKLIELQVKEAIFDNRHGRRVLGWHHDRTGAELFPTRFALDPMMIAEKIGRILTEEGRATEGVKAGLARIADIGRMDNAPDMAGRPAYFCSGCPHNRSTMLPAGARAYAGIGCHYMVQWMDRSTQGFTQMGGEGANWIGEAPFSTRPHIFQNLGDGTYNHSGVMAIRAALAANTTITYKILFNDAVAMTGGQSNEGGLTAAQIAHELVAMGVLHLAVVYDPKEKDRLGHMPPQAQIFPRDELMRVQEEMAQKTGVSIIIYVQTCAAEKRRRRKRGRFPDIDKRVYINPDVCEGCGDCGVQSNCVSLVPLDTPLGRKRAIDQSGCNKDFSCLNGFCPSFVTLQGAKVKQHAADMPPLPLMPAPVLPAIQGTYNIVITGIGGTGVVTLGALLAMAAHLDGKGAGVMEMAGLAQKGGAVHIHCRIAHRPQDISAIRVSLGEMDALIGGDLVVSAGSKTLALMMGGRAKAVVNDHVVMTGEFTRNRDFTIPADDLRLRLARRLGDDVRFMDTALLAQRLLGDALYANMVLLGMAWQAGFLPLSEGALREAIRLNKAGVEANLQAFDLGRLAWFDPDWAQRLVKGPQDTAPDPVAFRADWLKDYQDDALKQRYLARLQTVPDALRLSVAQGYYKLLAYKDEYEVARLHLHSVQKAGENFEPGFRPVFHLAPPFLGGKGPDGRPKKRAFGPWIIPLFRLLAKMRHIRGKWYDPFGHSHERRMERQLIAQYEADLDRFLPLLNNQNKAVLREIFALPLQIRGFGMVKSEAVTKSMQRRAELIKKLS